MKNSSFFVLAGFLLLFSCSSDDDPKADPCLASPPKISNAAVTNAACGQNNGSLLVTATGGKTPYQYSVNGVNFQEGSTFEGLAAGDYTITLKDANGCLATLQRNIEETSNMQVAGQLSAPAGCGSSNGVITVSANGGSGTYTYSLDGTNFQSANQFSNLASGNYTLSVKDANDCSATSSIKVTSGISFQNHVKSIIDTNCATAGCHVSGTGRQNFTNFGTIQASANGIKSRTAAGTMPPPASGKSLTDAEKQAIACWVDDGALNN